MESPQAGAPHEKPPRPDVAGAAALITVDRLAEFPLFAMLSELRPASGSSTSMKSGIRPGR